MDSSHPTAKYQIKETENGVIFKFYCDLSGALQCETSPIKAQDHNEALMIAWNSEGRKHFNHCHCCGRWVSNVMYNADELKCVHCAPWESEQLFCTNCGKPILKGQTFCPHCGQDLFKRRLAND